MIWGVSVSRSKPVLESEISSRDEVDHFKLQFHNGIPSVIM